MPALFARLIAFLLIGVSFVVGPLLLLLALGSSIRMENFIRTSLAAEGTILELRPVYLPRRSRYAYRPVFRFTADDGRIWILTAASAAHLTTPFRPGDQIHVLYPRDHPELARIDTFAQLWNFPVVSGFLGAVLTLFPLLALRRKRALRRARDLKAV
jgi:hypothetical protein